MGHLDYVYCFNMGTMSGKLMTQWKRFRAMFYPLGLHPTSNIFVDRILGGSSIIKIWDT